MFSSKGLEGARVDEIVKAGAVNVRMLYHYFGSKEGLYAAVLAELFESTLFDRDEGEIASLDLKQRFSHVAKFLIKEPDALRLLLWELASHDVQPNLGRQHEFQRLCAFLSNPKDLWAETGSTDPVACAHRLVRQTAFALQLNSVFGSKLDADEAVEIIWSSFFSGTST